MPVFNSRLPKPQASDLQLDRSASKPLSVQIRNKFNHAQSLFGFDKSNIVDYLIKPLDYQTGFETTVIQKFYVFYKKAARDKVLKIAVTPYQLMTNKATAWNYPHALYVDINELTVYTSPGDLEWASTPKGFVNIFKSDVSSATRLINPSTGVDRLTATEDYLNVSGWTDNQIYCFEIVVNSYNIVVGDDLPNIIGLGHIHFSVSPEDENKYIEEIGVGQDSFFIGQEIVKTTTVDSNDTGIRELVGEINKVKNSSFDHAQALFQYLPPTSTWTEEAGYETYLVPQENSTFGSPTTIPLITLNTPRFQKGYNGGNKTFTFCMKYIAPTTEPANHNFELEYRVTNKSGLVLAQNWTSLQIFNVPDNATIFTGDFTLPTSVSGYPLNACIVDFRILTTDTSYPFIVQNVSIIEKEYT